LNELFRELTFIYPFTTDFLFYNPQLLGAWLGYYWIMIEVSYFSWEAIMDKMKRKKVLSHSPRWQMKAFIVSMGLLIAAIHIFSFRMAQDSGDFPIPLILLVLIIDAFLLWWSYIFTTQSRVTIFEEGIELVRGGSRLFTKWDNISHLGIKGYGRNQQRGIFLYDKVKPKVNGLIEKLLFGRETDFIPIGRYVHLPRNWNPFNRQINTEKLLETEFGQRLYDYAPHLFDDYNNAKPKNRLEDDYQDDMDWYEEEMMENEGRG
jgi:hypothetical protein